MHVPFLLHPHYALHRMNLDLRLPTKFLVRLLMAGSGHLKEEQDRELGGWEEVWSWQGALTGPAQSLSKSDWDPVCGLTGHAALCLELLTSPTGLCTSGIDKHKLNTSWTMFEQLEFANYTCTQFEHLNLEFIRANIFRHEYIGSKTPDLQLLLKWHTPKPISVRRSRIKARISTVRFQSWRIFVRAKVPRIDLSILFESIKIGKEMQTIRKKWEKIADANTSVAGRGGLLWAMGWD